MISFAIKIRWKIKRFYVLSAHNQPGLTSNQFVVDPNTLNLDPDPGFWPNLDPDPDPGPDPNPG